MVGSASVTYSTYKYYKYGRTKYCTVHQVGNFWVRDSNWVLYCGRIECRTSSGVRPSPLHGCPHPAPGPTFPNAFISVRTRPLPLVEAQHVDDPRSRDAPSARQQLYTVNVMIRYPTGLRCHRVRVGTRIQRTASGLFSEIDGCQRAQSPPNSRYSTVKYLP
jgi:hypothetical protein